MSYDPEPDSHSRNKINLNQIRLIIQQKLTQKKQLVLMQQNLQNKVELASLKSEIDKIDVDKLETVPTDLNKLNDLYSR